MKKIPDWLLFGPKAVAEKTPTEPNPNTPPFRPRNRKAGEKYVKVRPRNPSIA